MVLSGLRQKCIRRKWSIHRHKHMCISILIREHDTWKWKRVTTKQNGKNKSERKAQTQSVVRVNSTSARLLWNWIQLDPIESPAAGRQTDRQTERKRNPKSKQFLRRCNNKNKNLCIYSNISVYEKKQKTATATATTMTAMTIRKKNRHIHTQRKTVVNRMCMCVLSVCILCSEHTATISLNYIY